MIWDIIGQKINTAGLGTFGEDMFVQAMPEDVNQGVAMFAPLDGIRMDPHLPSFYKPTIKIIVRDSKIERGAAKAKQIMDLLTVTGEEVYEANGERGKAVLKVFYPQALPIQFPRLDGNAIEWSINFQTAFHMI
jgi:hypothetical protein